jgi:hypothetical protein
MTQAAIKTFMEYLNTKFPEYQFTFNMGEKYCKVVRCNSASPLCVYCFIALGDSNTKTLGTVKLGDIMKPANWNTPAKHARGNVFDHTTFTCAGKYGMQYLRG